MDINTILARYTNFGAVDWAVVCVYLVGAVAVGFYVRRYIANMADYVVAGRGVRTYLGLATMIGTEMGLVTIMYMSQKGFTSGFSAFMIAVAAAVVTLLVGLTGFIVVPLRRMGVMTIPEYYERRFSRGVRVCGGLVLSLAGILNMGMFLYAGSVFVVGITGMSDPNSVKIVMTVLLGLVLLYTILGGMVSVVITDYVQFVVLSVGILAATFIALHHFHWRQLADAVAGLHGDKGFNLFLEPAGSAEGRGLDYMIWMLFLGLNSCAIWQTAVLRACAAESVKVVRRMYVWSSIGFLIRFLIPFFWGICALAFFLDKPELKALMFDSAGKLDGNVALRAMPAMLGNLLPVGLLGLLTAGMLAAFMSTHDSYLLCWSSVLTQDVVAPLTGEKLSTKNRVNLTRTFIFVIGIFLLIWSLWYPLGQDLWDYMAVSGGIYFTGAFAILVGGLYWKRASCFGAYASMACGLLMLFGLKPIQKTCGIDWSGERIGLAVVGLSSAAMIVGSLLVPDKKRQEGN
ncbi:MAG: sodium:solute symporter family protein [Phycisphaerae bacterium]|nr:sodium:solute symporter family protein [Phycisphaerae bacterium]